MAELNPEENCFGVAYEAGSPICDDKCQCSEECAHVTLEKNPLDKALRIMGVNTYKKTSRK